MSFYKGVMNSLTVWSLNWKQFISLAVRIPAIFFKLFPVNLGEPT